MKRLVIPFCDDDPRGSYRIATTYSSPFTVSGRKRQWRLRISGQGQPTDTGGVLFCHLKGQSVGVSHWLFSPLRALYHTTVGYSVSDDCLPQIDKSVRRLAYFVLAFSPSDERCTISCRTLSAGAVRLTIIRFHNER